MTTNSLEVYKNRTNIVRVSMGFDISGDTFESQIREKDNVASPLIATWTASFLTDGTDGELILTCDNSELDTVTQKTGYMDLKRISGGEPLPVYAPIKVVFIDTVTA